MNDNEDNIEPVTTHARSVVKAISWRVIATVTTMIVVYILTGEFVLALEVGAIEVVAKLVLYYLHERAWISLSWGTSKTGYGIDKNADLSAP